MTNTYKYQHVYSNIKNTTNVPAYTSVRGIEMTNLPLYYLAIKCLNCLINILGALAWTKLHCNFAVIQKSHHIHIRISHKSSEPTLLRSPSAVGDLISCVTQKCRYKVRHLWCVFLFIRYWFNIIHAIYTHILDICTSYPYTGLTRDLKLIYLYTYPQNLQHFQTMSK